MKTYINDYDFKQNLIQGESITFNTEDEDYVCAWFNKGTFYVEYNGRILKAYKQYKRIKDYLNWLGAYTENN